MSEFSNTYHLQSDSIEDGINMLKKSGLRGYVFKPANGWVSFVVEGDETTPSTRLISNNPGLLIHYQNADDLGFLFSIYEKNKRVSHYECFWGLMPDELQDLDDDKIMEIASGNIVIEEKIEIHDKELNLDYVYSLAKDKTMKKKELIKILHPKDYEEVFENEPALQVALLFELPHFDWISYHYLSLDEERDDFDYDCVKVN